MKNLIRKNIRKKKRLQSGQSVVELVVTLFAFFTVVFMVVQVALGFGVANYFQYVSFLSSRALLAGDATLETQVQAGKAVFEKMTMGANPGSSRFKNIAELEGDAEIGPTSRVTLSTPTGSTWPDGSRFNAWEQGTAFNFKIRMYMMPMVKGAKRGASNWVKLRSESWLGRESSEQECVSQLISKQGNERTFLFDNGC